ncbi:hypothetical protein B0T10DRAFT_552760 [Thelonectria olida]|uniref:Uncharacterized protein n=1 Tax=Thelonectria olida TaxID=1576542 RepID=A0A9P9AJV5_9HYPO|nr:hypothetical protein B0T10DRAFT_552760 [Thelonectria olida]
MVSEPIALTQIGVSNIADILPGTAVLIEPGSKSQFRQIMERKSYTLDNMRFPRAPKAICLENADEDGEVSDFKVGVFCGQYKTELPRDSCEQSRSRKRKTAVTADKAGLMTQ